MLKIIFKNIFTKNYQLYIYIYFLFIFEKNRRVIETHLYFNKSTLPSSTTSWDTWKRQTHNDLLYTPLKFFLIPNFLVSLHHTTSIFSFFSGNLLSNFQFSHLTLIVELGFFFKTVLTVSYAKTSIIRLRFV